VLTLLRCLVQGGYAVDRIALAAPTGRAAQRLTDSLRAGLDRLPAPTDADASLRGISATTLHGLLGFRPMHNLFGRHAENPVPADVVIVDEVSMVGLVLMASLLQALAPATKLILLGDKDQLPSVDAGAVLAHLVPSAEPAGASGSLQDRVVLLQTNHRSEPQIRDVAQAINRQDATIVDRLPSLSFGPLAAVAERWRELEKDGGCWLLEQTLATAGELRGFLQQWAEQAYFRSQLDGRTFAEWLGAAVLDEHEDHPARFRPLFTLMDRFRLLTLVRDGAWGCDEINAFLDLYLRPRLDGNARTALFAGAPVLITRNDSSRGLFNGDVGITLRDRFGGLRVLFERPDGAVSFPAESLPAHQLGFALTVHKSQGSEYANVMVVLPPKAGKRLLTKELIYTAITRAKTLAVICSAKDVLKFAISRRIVRESGLLRP
jgi:exodeoxyribonuclease V alpha subunit